MNWQELLSGVPNRTGPLMARYYKCPFHTTAVYGMRGVTIPGLDPVYYCDACRRGYSAASTMIAIGQTLTDVFSECTGMTWFAVSSSGDDNVRVPARLKELKGTTLAALMDNIDVVSHIDAKFLSDFRRTFDEYPAAFAVPFTFGYGYLLTGILVVPADSRKCFVLKINSRPVGIIPCVPTSNASPLRKAAVPAPDEYIRTDLSLAGHSTIDLCSRTVSGGTEKGRPLRKYEKRQPDPLLWLVLFAVLSRGRVRVVLSPDADAFRSRVLYVPPDWGKNRGKTYLPNACVRRGKNYVAIGDHENNVYELRLTRAFRSDGLPKWKDLRTISEDSVAYMQDLVASAPMNKEAIATYAVRIREGLIRFVDQTVVHSRPRNFLTKKLLIQRMEGMEIVEIRK